MVTISEKKHNPVQLSKNALDAKSWFENFGKLYFAIKWHTDPAQPIPTWLEAVCFDDECGTRVVHLAESNISVNLIQDKNVHISFSYGA